MKFKEKIKTSFQKAKKDINGFKQSMTDWIIFLDSNQRSMKTRLHDLEKRLNELESRRIIIR